MNLLTSATAPKEDKTVLDRVRISATVRDSIAVEYYHENIPVCAEISFVAQVSTPYGFIKP